MLPVVIGDHPVNPETDGALRRLLSLFERGKRRISLALGMGIHEVLSVFGNRDFVPFIVLTRSRTGSNMLLSFLNSHPYIYVESEIFARLNGKSHEPRLKKVFGRQPRYVKAKGFKIFYYHPLDDQSGRLWNDLERLPELRVIHLSRENMLRTLLSRKIAGQKGVWTGTRYDHSSDTDSKAVHLTAQELIEGFSKTEEWIRSAEVRFQRHRWISVSYEELIQNPGETFGQVLAFLGVKFCEPQTKLERQNPEDLSKLIENYHELKVAFSDTRWAHYFES